MASKEYTKAQKLAVLYWTKKLRGLVAQPGFKFSMTGNEAQSEGPDDFLVPISDDTMAMLRKVSTGSEESVYVLLLAALQITCHRYFQLDDVLVCTPGFFAADTEQEPRFIFVRTFFTSDLKIIDVINAIQKDLFESRGRGISDFEELRGQLFRVENTNETGLFNLFFTSDAISGDAKIPDKMGLALIYESAKGELRVLADAAKSDADFVRQFTYHYLEVLRNMISDVRCRVRDIELISNQEKLLLTQELKAITAGYNIERSVIELLEDQVSKDPSGIALQFKDHSLTRQGLNEKVNGLANVLCGEYGIGKGDFVAIMTDRSEWLVVGILAIIKTGAAFVPIDISTPTERAAYVIWDSAAKLILVDKSGDTEFPCESLQIDQVGMADRSKPEISIAADDIIFAIYTSGSTGKPKGVLQTHQCIANLIQWQINYEHFQKGLKVLQWSSLAFDACIHEILFALLSGGQICLVDEETRRDPGQLGKYIIDHQIEVFWQSASALNVLLEVSPEIRQAGKIKHIVSTGEQLKVGETLRNFLLQNPHIKLHNFYGPTETHVVTVCTIDSQEDIKTYQPIGKPLPNLEILILDRHHKLVPVGVEGQIYAGGPCLAAGYLNAPELTKDRFLTIDLKEPELFYKTGDRGRWLKNGEIQYLGRNDDQVKIRGQRVETGEVDALLLQIDGVEEAVTVAQEDDEGNVFLLACYVSGAEIPSEEFIEILSKKVPEYFIPSFFIRKERLPLTPTGKVDKKALRKEEIRDNQLISGDSVPATPTEIKLNELWNQILNRKGTIGIHSNFFKIGGHSLKATRLVSLLYKELGFNITLRDVFENPTIAMLANLVDHSKQSKYIPIKIVPEQEHYEVSQAQKRLWVIDQLEKDQVAYNMPGCFFLKGRVDIGAFEKALEGIIARHDILRTVFVLSDGEPKQLIQPLDDFNFSSELIDLRSLEDPESRVRKYLKEESVSSFDLEKGPLLRARLIRTGEEYYIFLLTLHHIICDGWSQDILMRELVTLYNSAKSGTDHGLPPLRIQYKDYAAWQNRQLENENLRGHESFWLDNLKGELPILELPSDRPRPQYQTFNGDFVTFDIPAELTGKLHQLAKAHDATIFMVLLSGVYALLYRYTSQEDIILGTPIAGRQHYELENQLGLYVNTLALRGRFNGDEAFISLLQNIRKTTLDAYDHQLYPFDFLVDRLEIPRLVNRNPLFDVMVALQNAHDQNNEMPEMDGVKVESSGIKDDASKFDIWLSFSETGSEISAVLQYNTDLFDKERMVRFCRHLAGMLNAVADEPEKPLNRLNYLSEEERSQLLYGFNQTAFPFPGDDTIVTLFEKQVSESPDAPALIYENEAITYLELNKRCNQIAHYLRAHFAIEAGDVLAVLFEDPVLKIISLMAILKSGAAYVPISPRFPVSRIDLLLKDSRASGVLSEKKLKRLSEKTSARQKVFLDDFEFDTYPESDLEEISASEDLIYVIYTSGSTGEPKGCELNHKGVVNRIHWMWRNYGFSPEDVILQKTPLIFDVSVWEVFMPLCFGAKLVVCNRDEAVDPESLLKIIRRAGVTTMHFVPSLLEMFVKSLSKENVKDCESLKRLILSGEALNPGLVRDFQEFVDVPLHNLYGPTEASVDVTSYEVPKNPQEMLIGKPIDNIAIYILDSLLQPVPVGITGELFISGVGLARGYRGKKELTDQRFLKNPYKEDERLYKTGDLGTWISSGDISYLGRNDDQIKIRGQRAEPGEIESVLSTHPGVDKAIIKVFEKDSENHFAAFILCDDEFTTPVTENVHDHQVTEWEEVFDHVYDQEEKIEQAESNFQGWIDSYTNKAFSEREMKAWLKDATDIIRDFKPKSVLEIGCGTGLVLFQVAPDTDRYVGTDISAHSINYVSRVLDNMPQLKSKIELQKKPAHDLAGIEDESFDCIILNSVIQYFPDVNYLSEVLAKAVRKVKPGGKIFLGDVRSKALARQFHLSVQRAKITRDISVKEFNSLLRNQVANDKELLVHPHLFYAIGKELPGLSHVEIRPKQQDYSNELSRYRYQAILHVGEVKSSPNIEWIDYRESTEGHQNILGQISGSRKELLGIRGVPNPDLLPESLLLQLIDGGEYRKMSELETAIGQQNEIKDLQNPFQKCSNEFPYKVYNFWAGHQEMGEYDVILIHKNHLADYDPAAIYHKRVMQDIGPTQKDNRKYTNHPVHNQIFSELVPELRSYLTDRLPLQMVPTLFLPIEEVPLTPSGKVDKKALTIDVKDRTGVSTAFLEAESPIEKKMLAIWKEVLNEDLIGVDDNFFELGGHSLKAVQLVSRIHKEFDSKLELRTVFTYPTISGLLSQLSEYQEDTFEHLSPLPPQPHYEASHAQNRLWILNQFEDNLSAYNMPGAYNIVGHLDVKSFGKAFRSLVERHESLRTSFVFIDGELKQRIHATEEASFDLDYLDLCEQENKEEQFKKILSGEIGFSFDVNKIPLIRARLIKIDSDDHIFLINMHHIISDGWSFNIIAEEMLKNYHAFRKGEESPMAPLTIQYKEFAAWQNRYLGGDKAVGHREYWKTQVADIPALELNTDHPRPDIRTFEGALVHDELGTEVLAGLYQLGKTHGSTLFMTLVACVKVLLYRYTGQEDIAIGSPVAGRNHKDLEGLVGFFINILVLRTGFDGDQDFTCLLENVKEVVLKAYEHQEYPFDKLVDEFAENRDVSRSPFFDVNVVLQNTDFSKVEKISEVQDEKDIRFYPVEMEIKASKFDLIFEFREYQDKLLIQVEYNKDLFRQDRIIRMLQHFKILVKAILANSKLPLNSLNYLTKEERDRILSLAQGK